MENDENIDSELLNSFNDCPKCGNTGRYYAGKLGYIECNLHK